MISCFLIVKSSCKPMHDNFPLFFLRVHILFYEMTHNNDEGKNSRKVILLIFNVTIENVLCYFNGFTFNGHD